MNLDLVLVRYLDGAAGPEEMEFLNRALREDPEARALLRAATRQVLELADLARARELRPARPVPARRTPFRLLAGVAALAAAVLLMARPWEGGKQAALVLSRVHGSASWRPESGVPRSDLAEGMVLVGPGALCAEGVGSSVEVRFDDGSTVELAGDAEVAFLKGVQKRLLLSRGSVGIDARPQPASRPMLLLTPTAEVSVVGTRFSLSRAAHGTRVEVDEGRVRLRRLTDGASIDVAPGQAATAALDPAVPLESRSVPAPSLGWRQAFERAPETAWKGDWAAGRLRAAFDVSYRRQDGTVVPAYVVSVGDARSALGLARPESLLRIRYRLRAPRGMVVLLSVQHPDGRFAGNFQVDLPPEGHASEREGWRTFQAPLSSLQGKCPEGARLPASGRLTLVYLACYFPDAELEVAELAVE